VSYLTNGISWAADYVAVVNADDSKTDLTGWVTITNQSGARYDDADAQAGGRTGQPRAAAHADGGRGRHDGA
jgi:hypothetical protein